jgi:phage baseplate assembly protein gpV
MNSTRRTFIQTAAIASAAPTIIAAEPKMSLKAKVEAAALDGVKVREQLTKLGGGPFTDA